MKLSPQIIFIGYVVFMAAVTSLEEPAPTAAYFWRWAYRFVNALAVNIPHQLPNRGAGRTPAEGQKP